MKKNIFKIVFIILIISGIVFLDLYSKYLIESTLEFDESIEIIKNFFSLTYVRNTGAAFSVLSGRVNLLIFISWAILFYLLYELYTSFKDSYYPYFISVLIGGLLGNLYDRVVLGYVRDFFDFRIFKYDFAIFNVSDIFVVIGTILLIIFIIFKGESNENSSKKRKRRKKA